MQTKLEVVIHLSLKSFKLPKKSHAVFLKRNKRRRIISDGLIEKKYIIKIYLSIKLLLH